MDPNTPAPRDEWLSAYLDGELANTPSPGLPSTGLPVPDAAAIEPLRRVRDAIAGLPRVSAPAGFRDQLLAKLRKQVAAPITSELSVDNASGLLNAYADDELSLEQRAWVDANLLSDARHRQTLDEIRSVSASLSGLPAFSAPRDLDQLLSERLRLDPVPVDRKTADRIADRQRCETPSEMPAVSANACPSDELLSAYVDGSLRGSDRQRVERLLEKSPDSRRKLLDFVQLRVVLADMPRLAAPRPAIDRVMKKLRKSVAAAKAQAAAMEPVDSGRRSMSWVSGLRVSAFASLAAAVLIVLNLYEVQAPSSAPPDPFAGQLAALPTQVAPGVSLVLNSDLSAAPAVSDLAASPVTNAPAPVLVAPVAPADVAVATSIPATPTPPVETKAAPAMPATLDEAVVLQNPFGRNFEAPEDWTINEPPTPPGLRAIEKLAAIRPGDLIQLDDSKIVLVCVDVERMYDRLRVLLVHNQIEDSKIKHKGNSRIIEVTASPDQLHSVLADIWQRDRRLIARSEIDSTQSPGLARGTPKMVNQLFRPSMPLAEPSAKLEEQIAEAQRKSEELRQKALRELHGKSGEQKQIASAVPSTAGSGLTEQQMLEKKLAADHEAALNKASSANSAPFAPSAPPVVVIDERAPDRVKVVFVISKDREEKATRKSRG